MTVQCAWCGCKLGFKPPLNNPNVTHGMCEECEEREFKALAKPPETSESVVPRKVEE